MDDAAEDEDTTATTASVFTPTRTAATSISFQDKYDEEVYDIRDVSPANPLLLLSNNAASPKTHRSSSRRTSSSASSSAGGMLALPVSEDGFRFMRERRPRRHQPQQEETGGLLYNEDKEELLESGSVGVGNSVRWRLSTPIRVTVDEGRRNAEDGSNVTMA